jgi:hypothetical protein
MATPTRELTPDELARLEALAGRLAARGYTQTSAGVEKFKGEPIMYVRGLLNGLPMELSMYLSPDPAMALRHLSRGVEREARVQP